MNKEVSVIRNGGELTFTKVVNAPKELVWEAWTNPNYIKEWWGPDGFEVINKSMNAVEGGNWRFTMRSFGQDYENKVVYLKMLKPEFIIYKVLDDSDEVSESEGFLSKVTFEEINGITKVTLINTFNSSDELDKLIDEVNALEGGKQTITRMSNFVQKSLIKTRYI